MLVSFPEGLSYRQSVIFIWNYLRFCHAMLWISAAYAVMWCLSVCVSVTFVHCVKTNKHIFNFCSPSGSHTILVFLYQTALQYSDGNPPNGGIQRRWGRLKSRNQWLSGLAINNCTVVCISHSAATFLFTAGIGRPSAIYALLCTVRDRPSAVSRYTQSRWT